MNTKDKIYELIKNADGWINVDEISAAIKLNRSDVAITITGMMKQKMYQGIERNGSRSTTKGSHRADMMGIAGGQRAVYDIKYRYGVEQNENN